MAQRFALQHGEEAKSQVIGALCDKVFSLRLWLFVSFEADFSLYCLNHRIEARCLRRTCGVYAMMAPMKPYAAVLILSAFLVLPAAKVASDPQSHTLYGDLKVDEKKNVGIPPLNYTLVLYAIQGRGLVLGRTTVTPNGRYRFFNVPNGEYEQVKKGSKAVVCLNEALKLDPIGMADAHMRLAALYNAAGYKDRAAAEYEQFLSKRPDYPEKEKLLKYIRENKKLSNPW
jgi:tetratricopeptide (TPR) repeat protein